MAFKDYEKTDGLKGYIGTEGSYKGNKIDTVTFDYKAPLNIGKIAQYKDGVLCNLDSTPTPKIAGIVLRSNTNAVESGDTYISTGDGAVHQVNVLSFGLASISIVDGITPTFMDKIYVIVSGDDAGKVTTDSTALEIKGYFNRPVETGIWEVFIQL